MRVLINFGYSFNLLKLLVTAGSSPVSLRTKTLSDRDRYNHSFSVNIIFAINCGIQIIIYIICDKGSLVVLRISI